MTNPYETPQFGFDAFKDPMHATLPSHQGPGLVAQVRVVAILMIVQGALELLMGLFYCSMGVLMSTVMRGEMENSPAFRREGGPLPEMMLWMPLAVYAGMGMIALVAGALHAWAGWRNYQFRSRTLGVVALVAGMATIVGCYCAPTAIALAVYGLIVYLNGPVTGAFHMAQRGHSADAILAGFYQSP